MPRIPSSLIVAVVTLAVLVALIALGVALGSRMSATDATSVDALDAVTTSADATTTTVLERHEASDVPLEAAELIPPLVMERQRATVTHVRPAAADRDTAALEQIIRDGFARFGAGVAEEAVRVAHCEAPHETIPGALDPSRTGAEGEVGLLQIHPKFHTERAAKFGWSMADLYAPVKNVVVAADLYAEQGWQPWTCRYAA